MTIIGIEGGIGTGKTLSLVHFGIMDLQEKELLYTNVALKHLPKTFRKRVIYLTKDKISEIFELIKTGKFNMSNSTVIIQEAHNYLDSRASMSKKNKALSYWILQSRHTGAGTCDILYDTQEFGQVDLRLRNNTDIFMRPMIVARNKEGIPTKIRLYLTQKVYHQIVRSTMLIDISQTLKHYDTHEVVDFI